MINYKLYELAGGSGYAAKSLSANNSGYSMPNKSRFHLLQSKIAGTNSVVIEIEQMELALVDDLVGYKAQLK